MRIISTFVSVQWGKNINIVNLHYRYKLGKGAEKCQIVNGSLTVFILDDFLLRDK